MKFCYSAYTDFCISCIKFRAYFIFKYFYFQLQQYEPPAEEPAPEN